MTAAAPTKVTASSETESPFVAPDKREFRVILIGLVVALLLSALDNTIVGTAMPTIVGRLGGFSKAAWVSTAYVVTSTIATLVLGKLSDLFGRRRVFLFAITVFLIASLLCGASQNMTQLIVFRALQGIGGGGIWGLTFAIVGDLVPPRDRGNYFGIFTGVFALASVAGPLVGGVIVDHFSWRWIFYVNVPTGLIAIVLVTKNLRLPKVTRKVSIDYLGVLLISVAIGSLMIGIERYGELRSLSGSVVSLFAVAAVTTVLFVLWELRAPEPVLPMRLFSNPVIRIVLLLGLLVGSSMMTAGWFFSFFFQDVRFYSPTKAGLSTIPIMIGMMVASTAVGRLITKWGRYRVFPLFGTPLTLVGLVLASRMTSGSSYGFLALAMLLIGVGMGCTMPSMSIAAQNSADPRDLGIATSSSNFFRSLGSSIGLAIYGTVFNNRVRGVLQEKLPEGAVTGDLLKVIREPKRVEMLEPVTRNAITDGISAGAARVFAFSVVIGVLSMIVAQFLRDEPLRSQTGLEQRAGMDH